MKITYDIVQGFYKMKGSICSISILLMFFTSSSMAQQIGVYNSSHKLLYKYKSGKDIDFRIDYKKLYPDGNDSILESRVFGAIDSISGKKMFLVDNYLVVNFTKDAQYLVEMPLEYTELALDIEDIKSLSFNPPMKSVGTALIGLGIAAVLISPLFGLNPGSEYSTERMAIVAGMGVGTAAIGTAFYIGFGQKPVKIKQFDGVDYFKKYQKGSVSLLE